MQTSTKHTYLKMDEYRDYHGIDLASVGVKNMEPPLVAIPVGHSAFMKSWSRIGIRWFLTSSPEDKVIKSEKYLDF